MPCFFTLANQMHEGRNICLGKLILGSLYESLGLEYHALKHFEPKPNLPIAGPFWLLQDWLYAMFEYSLKAYILASRVEKIQNRWIKGTRITLLTPTNTECLTQEVFTEYVMMFSIHYVFTHSKAPFDDLSHGPD